MGDRRLRVALNFLSAHGGAGVVCNAGLMSGLARMGDGDEYHVVLGRTQEGLAGVVPSHFRVHCLPFDSRRVVVRLAFEQVLLPLLLRRWKIDVLYSVGNLTTLLAPCPTVVMVENANPFSIFDLPWTWQQRVRIVLLGWLSRLSVRRACRVRFPSHTSRERLGPQLGIPHGKIVVIPHAVGTWDSEDTGMDLPPRFVLVVTALAPYKNLERLLEAFAYVIKQQEYSGSLVIVGPPLVRTTVERVTGLRRQLGLEDRVWLLGELPHDRVMQLYHRADVLAMVSLEETFGLPALEAMSCGLPVVVGELPEAQLGGCLPFREICGDAAVYCNPLSTTSIADALTRALVDEGLRGELKNRGMERAMLYNWEDTARALRAVFRECYREGRSP